MGPYFPHRVCLRHSRKEMPLGHLVSCPAHPRIFLDSFICCFTEAMLALLILWKDHRGPLNSQRNAVEDTNAGLDSVTPASDLK